MHIAGVLLGFLTVLPAADGAELVSTPDSDGHEILVLRNGQVMEGRITRSDSVYVVGLSYGEIRVKAADVDLVCRSLEDGYQKKRAAIQIGSVHQHLELAQWCLRHNLLGPASAELADAMAVEPNHPMLGAMQHRLKMAMDPPAATDVQRPRSVGPSNDDLDRMVHSLPHGAVETFTQSVQPVLMNHCATGGCHGPQSETPLRLFRVAAGKSVSRRITQRNLYTVLPYIDRDNPGKSRLLTAAAEPHGTAKHATFSEHQVGQYLRLSDWACQLAQHSLPEVPATLGIAASDFGEPMGMAPPQLLSHEAAKAHALAPTNNGKTPTQGDGMRADAAGKTSLQSSTQPADPHDPEVFNRRYAVEREKQQEKPEAVEQK